MTKSLTQRVTLFWRYLRGTTEWQGKTLWRVMHDYGVLMMLKDQQGLWARLLKSLLTRRDFCGNPEDLLDGRMTDVS